jgi:hypothetical protein
VHAAELMEQYWELDTAVAWPDDAVGRATKHAYWLSTLLKVLIVYKIVAMQARF